MPGILAKLGPFIKHAEQLENRDPIMSYYCRYYAVQEGIKMRASNPDEESKKVLLELMDQLEKQKERLADKVEDPEKGEIYVQNFALRVFKMADDEDRAGLANKGTSKNYLAAAQFFEVLHQFYKDQEFPPDLAEKQRYAKWKALDISQALKKGIKPNPGPPGEEKNQKDSFPNVPRFQDNSTPDVPEFSIPSVPDFNDSNFSNPPINSQPPSMKLQPPKSNIPPPENSSAPHFPTLPKNVPPPQPSISSIPKNVPSNAIPTPYASNYQPIKKIGDFTPTDENVANATKYAKFVVSSLQFEDNAAAVKYLKMALKELTGQDV